MPARRLSEGEQIAEIRRMFADGGVPALLGIGDDAALLPGEAGGWVVTKDLLIEDYHFLSEFHPPDLLGRKSLNVNLSDLAAMGSRPRYALLGLGLPSGISQDWIRSFFAGLRSAAIRFGVALVGGDLTGADKITISVTALGTAPARGVIRRSGAEPGDAVYVSGTLGDSAGGLALVRRGVRPDAGQEEDRLIRAFLDPEPQVELGIRLGEGGAASAMIDVSDGLSTDLGHICEESGTGAEIREETIPISEALRRSSGDCLRDALHGGEDYQLILTVPPAGEGEVLKLTGSFPLTRIGKITADPGLMLIGTDGRARPLEKAGWRHF